MSAQRGFLASLVLFAILLACVTATRFARADGRARPAPIAKWVDREPADPRGAGVTAAADDGVVWLLSDRQYRGGKQPDRYTRMAFRVESTTGIETISELHLDYDPTFEKLAIHYVHILRGGRVIDALAQADWKVIQPESSMDERIYSGELQGLLFLHDVRVGDVVDYAYSIRGDNPIVAGHFVRQVLLYEESDVGDLRRRIVTDGDHALTLKPHGAGLEPAESDDGPLHTYTWRRSNVKADDDDDKVPSWYRSDGWIDVSDYAGWNEVAAASAALFDAAAAKPTPELRALVDKWQTELSTPAERALAATRFVQDEVRYLGIEMGPHSHQPFPVGVVLGRRFGDCKDKSLLLVTLLRALGVDASPALVSTRWLQKLDDLLPSPFAFDHVIVRAALAGLWVYIDATASMERGLLWGRRPPPYQRALPVLASTQKLELMGDPRPSVPTSDVDETYTLRPPGGGPVRLDLVTTYRDEDADDMRARIADTSPEELGKRYVNYYADTFPEIRALGDPAFQDDTDKDVLVVTEHYEVPGFYKGGTRDLFPDVFTQRLKSPKVSRRHAPLGVTFPDRIAQHQHVVMGGAPADPPKAVVLRDGSRSFQSSGQVKGDVVTIDYEYEARADSVAVGDVPAHLAMLEKVNDWGYSLDENADAPAKKTPGWNAIEDVPPAVWWLGGGSMAVVACAASVGGAIMWRKQRAARRRATLQAGEAPISPIVVARPEEIDMHVGGVRCACRAPLSRMGASMPAPELRLGDRIVCAVPVACTGCGTARRMYFEVRTGAT